MPPNLRPLLRWLVNINSNYNALVGEVVNHSLKNIQFDANYTLVSWS